MSAARNSFRKLEYQSLQRQFEAVEASLCMLTLGAVKSDVPTRRRTTATTAGPSDDLSHGDPDR